MLRLLIALVIVGAVLYVFDQAFHPTAAGGATTGGGSSSPPAATPSGPAPSAPSSPRGPVLGPQPGAGAPHWGLA